MFSGKMTRALFYLFMILTPGFAQAQFMIDQIIPPEATTCVSCSSPKQKPLNAPDVDRAWVAADRLYRYAPVWAKFRENFRICAPGCTPVVAGIRRDGGGRTCHHVDRAIDVGGIKCDGQISRAIDSRKFAQFVACMKPKIKTLWHNKSVAEYGITDAHYDHAHFSIGCYGGTFW